ncbi:TetR/AcrR family transcriptional regulator [Liquorilactobacillus uvarum]|uniref:TetR/AcrR family transcriptional regulator n=2 Tax=Liquorilactobacillus uvarum TaxID=303240 RepID=UPI00288A8D68|nr:helix-turn-helix domain-containing protein [Liquorilactobacillus uvarum]
MGRKKSFQKSEILKIISTVFVKYGFEGTSLDDLVKATGLLRGSLYSAFGSKRGMFIDALSENIKQQKGSEITITLVIIAMMELAAKDNTIRRLLKQWYKESASSNVKELLGRAVLKRSGILEGEE